MFIFKTHTELLEWLQLEKDHQHTIGFVPTMGALHSGHISLLKKALEQTDKTLVSIFVNPKQFNNPIDFEKYPITITEDIAFLESAGCHAVYIPNVQDIYPEGLPNIDLNLGILNEVLEGPKRPGHFDGVVQVVHRFFSIIQPNKVYLGLKDFQQCKVIEALTKTYFPNIHLEFCATERELTGLAKSSRNMRLSETGKATASYIYQALQHIAHNYKKEDLNSAKRAALHFLNQHHIEVEYLESANSDTLALTSNWEEPNHNIVLLAAYLENVRLIDNIQF
ncbi:MAG: pantoate--beta-alanine ligase [bacterium]|nr:pantoate--beta-alanine ligase [bacterium]